MTQVFSPTDAKPNPTPGAPGAQPVNVAAAPTLSDMELVGRLRTLFSRARAERKPTVAQWVKNYRIMRNRTWLSQRPDWMPTPEVPEVRSIVASCVAWLTDQRPAFELTAVSQPFSPYAQFFEGLATDMKTAVNAAWQTYQYESVVERVAWDAYQYDIGWFKTYWNPALADGLGDVDLSRCDPFTIYPDPQASTLADCNYIFEARTISLQELDRRFPGAAAKFDVQGYTENVDEMPSLRLGVGRMPHANPGAISPATTARYGLPGQGSRDRASRDDTGVTLLECWLREHTVKDGKVYECWRCICIAGPHVLMNKRADEILPFTTHPYDTYIPEDIGEMFGQSMVEILTPSQVSINRLLASMQQNIDLVGNPVWKEGTRSGLQRTKITNKPGQRVTVADGDQSSGWEQPPTLSPESMPLVQFHISEMERASGLSAIQRGVAPGGRIASDVLDSVMEAGFVRLRLAQRNLEYALRKVGQKMVAIVSEFYTDPRFLAIVGPDGRKTVQSLKGRHFYMPSADGAVPLKFQINVQAGSMLPTTRNARISEYDTLFAMGAIDRPVLLEAHDVPNRQAIADRMAEQDAKGMTQAPGARQRAQH
jgi:hypothetical protein